MITPGGIPVKKITDFCKKHPIIAKMSLFGSALSGTLRKDSDIDLLVEFEPGKTPSLFALIDLEDELTMIVGRKIDLRTPQELSRYFRDEVLKALDPSMLSRDYVRLQHMLDSSQAAVSHLSGKYREDLDRNRLLLNGVVRELEILGEAASQVTKETRERFPFLPWREMIGLRNRLIHAYFDVNNQAIWLVVKESLPTLISQLEEILQNWPSH